MDGRESSWMASSFFGMGEAEPLKDGLEVVMNICRFRVLPK